MSNSSLKDQLNKSIKLAHLELATDEKKSLLSDLEKILDFVQVIKKAEKEGRLLTKNDIDPTDKEYPQTKKRNVLREDFIEPFTGSQEIMKEVPQTKNNLIKVKRI